MHAGYFNVLYICAPTQQQTITKKTMNEMYFIRYSLRLCRHHLQWSESTMLL